MKSSGIKWSHLDPIPARILCKCWEEFLPVILETVNLSLSTGSIDGPTDAVILPLLKKPGLDPNLLSNYRPISNLMFLEKNHLEGGALETK